MALISVAGPAAIALWFSKEHRGVPLAIWSLWVPIGSTVGMNVVPQVLKSSTWQTVYWLNAAFAFVAFVCYFVFYRDPRPDEAVTPVSNKAGEKTEILKTC